MKQKRQAVIMGATSGIGLEVARTLASKGWGVGIAGRRQELLTEIQRNTPNIIATECIDVTRNDAPERLQTLIQKMGGIDLYFHSSGIGYQNTELDMERELATVETNALGMTRMVGAAFNHFEQHPEHKAQIAVISSIARTKGLGAAPAYSSTKRYTSHYLECLTQLCHLRHLHHINIHDIRPGFVRTPLISGSNYPLQLDAAKVARQIVHGLERGHSIITIDWRYRLLVFFWNLIPRWLWVRLPLLALMFGLMTLAVSCNNDDDIENNAVVLNANRNDATAEPALQRMEFPKVKGGNSLVIIHTNNDEYGINYSVEWDCDKRSQRWSCYQMYATNRVQKTKRYYPDQSKGQTQYPYDPDLPSKHYFSQDPFWGSGYDHGHICPSADRLYSVAANIQTFYLTNMQPQRNAFNSGIWQKMEEKLRSWISTGSKKEDTLYVCKGGTIDIVESEGGIKDPILTTLANGLIVPKYFFMALLRKSNTGYKALAFWAEHLNEDHSNDALSNYVINIRELERRTGIDFFCNLPDNIEEEVETTSTENIKWLWNL